MKKIAIVFIFLLAFSNLQAAPKEVKWREQRSTHFIVYYKNAGEPFVIKLIDKAESLYNGIADRLGFVRYDFWLWDNRAKIYIYDDAKDYQDSTGQPSWAGGSAITQAKTIHSFPYAEGFNDTILPHELGHIIFREFVGFNNQAVPLWLEEGVATYQEKSKYSASDELVKKAITEGRFMGIERLSSVDLRSLSKEDVELFYCEAFGIINFLIKKHGKDAFVLFCQRLRDGKSLDKAIASVYPYNNTLELGAAWERYLKK